MRNIQGRQNENDVAILGGPIALNQTTSVILRTAGSKFLFWALSNTSNRDIFIKLQAASVDNVQKGILVQAGGGYWEMPTNNHYTGEISGISIQGTGKDVYLTEY